MKILLWNVGQLDHVKWSNINEYLNIVDADFVCIQNHQLQEKPSEMKLEGYVQFWNCAEEEFYSGTAIFAKEQPISVQYGMQNEEYDKEARLIVLEYEKFYLLNSYTPLSGEEVDSKPYSLTWGDEFCRYLKCLDEKKPVLVCGDLNIACNNIGYVDPRIFGIEPGNMNVDYIGLNMEEQYDFTQVYLHFYPYEKYFSHWYHKFNPLGDNPGVRIGYCIVSNQLKDQICFDVDYENWITGFEANPIELVFEECIKNNDIFAQDGKMLDKYTVMKNVYTEIKDTEIISEKEAESWIRIFSFLEQCDNNDLCRLFDTSVFNGIVKKYVEAALSHVNCCNEDVNNIMEKLNCLLDLFSAKEICSVSVT